MSKRADTLLQKGTTDEIVAGFLAMMSVQVVESDELSLPQPVYDMVHAMVAACVQLRDLGGKPIKWTDLKGNLGFERYVALSEHAWLDDEHRARLLSHLNKIGVDEDIRQRLQDWRALEEQGFPRTTWKAEIKVLPKSFIRVASHHDDYVNGVRRPDTFKQRGRAPGFFLPGWSGMWELPLLGLLAVIAYQWVNWPMLAAWGEDVKKGGVIAIGLIAMATLLSIFSPVMRAARNWLVIFVSLAAAGACIYAQFKWSLPLALVGLLMPLVCAITYQLPIVHEATLKTEGTWRAIEAIGFLSFLPALLSPTFAYEGSVTSVDAIALGAAIIMQAFMVYSLLHRIDWGKEQLTEDVQVEMEDQKIEEDVHASEIGEELMPLPDESWPTR